MVYWGRVLVAEHFEDQLSLWGIVALSSAKCRPSLRRKTLPRMSYYPWGGAVAFQSNSSQRGQGTSLRELAS